MYEDLFEILASFSFFPVVPGFSGYHWFYAGSSLARGVSETGNGENL